ncbi:MAG TPA: ABC transporter permease [Candidatus Limnocylindrales bacterium]|nr:ABC transporter permease [Candidatus Limnocylindrales bacterium]
MSTAEIAVRREAPVEHRASIGLWSHAWWSFRRDRLSMAALGVIIVLALLSAAAPLLAEHVFHFRYEQQDLLRAYHKPTLDPPQYLLGGDEIGRSQVVRLLYGGQVSLMVGFVAAFLALTIGVGFGLLAGYIGGRVDDLYTWFVATLTSVPTLFLLLIITSLFSPSAMTLTFIIGALFWIGSSNQVRAQSFSLREQEFVKAALTIGASRPRIMLRHILPNVLPIVFTVAAIDIGAIILTESALSFLGLGIMPPTPSWGNMLTNAAQYFNRAWWLVLSPGFMIWLTVLCLFLVGDGLRDALDPRLKGSK